MRTAAMLGSYIAGVLADSSFVLPFTSASQVRPEGGVDSVSAQFSLQYAFGSEESASSILREVAALLRQDGMRCRPVHCIDCRPI